MKQLSMDLKKVLVFFNYDQMKLKGYRVYFQEKQIEM